MKSNMDLSEKDFIAEENFDYVLKPSLWGYFSQLVFVPFLFCALGYLFLTGKFGGLFPNLKNEIILIICIGFAIFSILLAIISRNLTTFYLHHDYLVYKTGIFPKYDFPKVQKNIFSGC